MGYKIYSIKSKSNPDLQYIGSTKNSLNRRLRGHTDSYKNYLNGKYSFVTSFDIIKYGDCYIELYCDTATDDKRDARWLEGQIIRAETCVNKVVPGRIRQEYDKQYREHNKDKFKEYYINNKYRIKEYKKQKFTCECGSIVSLNNRGRHFRSKKHKNFIS